MSVRFHRRHGESVELVRDGRTARRVGYKWTSLFTERRLQRDGIWTLKVESRVGYTGCVILLSG